MKNTSLQGLAFCISVFFLFSFSCKDTNSTDSKTQAEQENISAMEQDDNTILVVETDNDAKFLMAAAELQLEEIKLGTLAQEKGTSQHVKDLGKMMVSDHTNAMTELKALAASKSVSIPNTTTEDSNDNYMKLTDKSGNDFGKAYSQMMVDHHKDAISLFEKASEDAEDQEIQTWAMNKLPGLKMHLEHAEKCKEACDKMKS